MKKCIIEAIVMKKRQEGQGRSIIMVVTRLLLLGPFYTIQTNFIYFFAHDCMYIIGSKHGKKRLMINPLDLLKPNI